MGYSCTQAATHMLGVIRHSFAKSNGSNTLTIKGKEYFYEGGEERRDGAIVGELFLMLPNNLARKVGNYRINPDGTIGRFPVMTAEDRKEAEATLQDMSARNQHLLHAWAIGSI